MFPTQDHIDAAISSAEYWYTQKSVYSFPSFRLAQTALESANGTALTGTFNFWGVKANKAQIAAGQFKECATHEVINGQRVATTAKFACYDSLPDGYIDQAQLLVTGSPYAVSRKDTDAKQYAIDVATHYATDPNYAKSIIAYMDQHNLYQYDHTTAQLKAIPVKTALKVPLHLEKKAVATASTGTAIVIGASGAAAVALHTNVFQSYGLLAAGAVVGLVCLGLTVLRIMDARKTLAKIVAPVAPAPVVPTVVPTIVLPATAAIVVAAPVTAPGVATPIIVAPPVVPEVAAPAPVVSVVAPQEAAKPTA